MHYSKSPRRLRLWIFKTYKKELIMSHEDFCFKLIIINAIINNVTIILKDNVTGREVLKIVYGTFFHIFMELKCASKWKTMTVLKVCLKNAF